MAEKKKFDDIFENTAGKKKPATKTAKIAAKTTAAPRNVAAKKAGDGAIVVDKFKALDSALLAHCNEANECRTREDRFFVWSTALNVAVILAAMLALYGNADVGWFGRLALKLLLCGGVAVNAVFTSGVLESNRKQLGDLLGIITKINERLGFFKPGTYDDSSESFYPNSYKFAGTDSEEEANLKTLFVKGLAGFAVFVILLVV